MCGTPAYLAPEVVRQTPLNPGYDNLVDSWSVGIIVYAMLTNLSPIQEDENQLDMRIRILNRTLDISPLREFDVSDKCEDFIVRLLDDNPVSRMNLAAALQHPWLLEYTPVYGFDGRVPIRLIPEHAPNGVSANPHSQSSIFADASMISATGSQIAPGSQDSVFPPLSGSTGAPNPNVARNASKFFQRRGDIVAKVMEGQLSIPVMPDDVWYSNGLPVADNEFASNGNAEAGPSNPNGQARKRRRGELSPPREEMNGVMDVSPVKKARDSMDDEDNLEGSSSSSSGGKKPKSGRGKTKATPSDAQPRRSGRNAQRGVAK